MQVIVHQRVTGHGLLFHRDRPHGTRVKASLSVARAAGSWPRSWLLLALGFSLPAPLSAQSPGQIRAQATVLPAQQSREALSAAWQAIANGQATARSTLATVQVTPSPVEVGMLPDGLPPRRPELVRIDFLRN
jgi:hypothetical protein